MLPPLQLHQPGLFVTATDTEVGKTTVTCALAAHLRALGQRVGVCKPIASGCRPDREGLVSPDAEALAHFADSSAPLDTITPVRYRAPLAPAAAAELEKRPVNYDDIAHALRQIDAAHDAILVEGIGGLLVPLDARHDLLDLMRWIGYPVLVVTRPDLGTLNHTAMTCRLIREAGLRLAGLVVNAAPHESADAAILTNPKWLEHQNAAKILATVPRAGGVDPAGGALPPEITQAFGTSEWRRILDRARRAGV